WAGARLGGGWGKGRGQRGAPGGGGGGGGGRGGARGAGGGAARAARREARARGRAAHARRTRGCGGRARLHGRPARHRAAPARGPASVRVRGVRRDRELQRRSGGQLLRREAAALTVGGRLTPAASHPRPPGRDLDRQVRSIEHTSALQVGERTRDPATPRSAVRVALAPPAA